MRLSSYVYKDNEGSRFLSKWFYVSPRDHTYNVVHDCIIWFSITRSPGVTVVNQISIGVFPKCYYARSLQ